ncbi:MAG: hypothetical protein KF875_08495 [Trueperaceae bacterium]|nr:hypothetical protein [Trueperaceae bacterium]
MRPSCQQGSSRPLAPTPSRLASRAPTARPVRARLRALRAAFVLALSGGALAHATLVFGTVTTHPTLSRAGERITLNLKMHDPVSTPVEDAIVFLEAGPHSDLADVPGESAESLIIAEPVVSSERFAEVAPGVYQTEFVLPHGGAWRLVFRDQTFRQEEARAGVTLVVGEGATAEPLYFVFPPTATGPESLATWLVFVVGIPLLAGVGITVAALRKGADEAPTREPASAGGADADSPEAP